MDEIIEDREEKPKRLNNGRPPDEVIALRKAKFRECLKDPEFILKTQDEQCEELGIARVTLWKWKKEISPAEWEKIREGARRLYAQHAPEIDLALVEKAKRGDIKAIELFYQRHEAWSVKQNIEMLSKTDLDGLTKDQLLEKVKAIMGSKGPIKPEIVEDEGKKAENG